MRRRALALLASAACLAASSAPAHAAPPADPLEFLKSISGTNSLSGQHNKEPLSDPTRWTQKIHDITGDYPGLWGGDFLFAESDVQQRQNLVDEAINQWNNGALVTLTWHVCPPTQGSACGWEDGVMSELSDEQWAQLITDGSELNRTWRARLDEAVPYLRQLQDAGVQVLWRSLHEINDGWSWWGGCPGPDGSAALYRITHEHLDQQGLTNLVWNWNVKDSSITGLHDYWPTDDRVDVASLDVWEKATPSQADYDAMKQVAGGRPIALGEVGAVPAPELLDAQPEWSYFMLWAEHLDQNDPAEVQRTYWDDRVLVLDEMRG